MVLKHPLRSPFALGISGTSCAGKSTLETKLTEIMVGPGCVRAAGRKRLHYSSSCNACRVTVISQDSFFLATGKEHWQIGSAERTDSLDHAQMMCVLKEELADQNNHCVILEGFRCFHDAAVLDLLDLRIWLEVPFATVKTRRQKRNACWTDSYISDMLWPHHIMYKDSVFARISVVTPSEVPERWPRQMMFVCSGAAQADTTVQQIITLIKSRVTLRSAQRLQLDIDSASLLLSQPLCKTKSIVMRTSTNTTMVLRKTTKAELFRKMRDRKLLFARNKALAICAMIVNRQRDRMCTRT